MHNFNTSPPSKTESSTTKIKNKLAHILFGMLLSTCLLPGIVLSAIPSIPTWSSDNNFGMLIVADAPQSATTTSAAPTNVDANNFHPGHYMLVGPYDSDSAFNEIRDNNDFLGVKKVYTWKGLEPAENDYNFDEIAKDLQYLQAMGKRLWLEVTITRWSPTSPNTPRYMWNDPKYGGVDPNYYGSFQYTPGSSAWRAIIWNNNVSDRLVALYAALGERFNNEPYFEGINVGETSMEAGPKWTSAGVEAAFKKMALGAKRAFPNKVVFLQPNWGPPDPVKLGEWLSNVGVAIGAPDTVINGKNPWVLDMQKQYHDNIPTGPDVQWDNYERGATSAEILDYAVEKANPWYMFWEKRDPYFNSDVIPTIRNYGPLPAAQDYYNSLK